jgi:Flp pilus assembly protein TadG
MIGNQRGLTTVEFAIVGLLFFVILFAVIEFGRLLFAWNTLAEVTRRGARLAVVCPVDDAASIQRLAVLMDADGTGQPVIGGLSPSHVNILYLDSNGTTVANPQTSFGSIQYVQVQIDGYQHQFIVPVVGRWLTPPAFQTTLPRESLGFAPDVGATPCST